MILEKKESKPPLQYELTSSFLNVYQLNPTYSSFLPPGSLPRAARNLPADAPGQPASHSLHVSRGMQRPPDKVSLSRDGWMEGGREGGRDDGQIMDRSFQVRRSALQKRNGAI